MRLKGFSAVLNWPLLVGRVLFVAFLSALLAYALWPWLPGLRAARPRTIVVYGFSILGEVMNEGVFPAFQAQHFDRFGERIEFISSFAGSGTITNQIILGVPAQVAVLSLELDAQRLVEARVLPRSTWLDLPQSGVVNRTPFIILVRRGNPKGIRGFGDLTRPGIGVVHADPLTSGGAIWALVAEYGSAARGDPNSAEAGSRMLLGIWRNVVAQASSARAARTQFENGFGDALITYEQEALRDRARGKLKGEIVYPQSTISSEHTVVVLDKNIGRRERELVNEFVDFLWSDTAQGIFVQHGYRSVDEPLNAKNPSFGHIADPFRIQDLGGWKRVRREIFEEIWKKRILPEVGR
jgi:ABC-type sulfate transport system substrate-binding protein